MSIRNRRLFESELVSQVGRFLDVACFSFWGAPPRQANVSSPNGQLVMNH